MLILEVMWAALVSPLPGVGGPYAQVPLAHLVQDSRFPGCLHLQLGFTPPKDGLRPQHCSRSIQAPPTIPSHHIAPWDPLATSSCCAPWSDAFGYLAPQSGALPACTGASCLEMGGCAAPPCMRSREICPVGGSSMVPTDPDSGAEGAPGVALVLGRAVCAQRICGLGICGVQALETISTPLMHPCAGLAGGAWSRTAWPQRTARPSWHPRDARREGEHWGTWSPRREWSHRPPWPAG